MAIEDSMFEDVAALEIELAGANLVVLAAVDASPDLANASIVQHPSSKASSDEDPLMGMEGLGELVEGDTTLEKLRAKKLVNYVV